MHGLKELASMAKAERVVTTTDPEKKERSRVSISGGKTHGTRGARARG
jgi:hypothetical protein